jgi:uncharacterized membrane protein YuzA (DUF378 family)
MDEDSVSDPSGSGNKLTRATVIVAGVAALVACLISFVSMWFQLKSKSLLELRQHH